MTFDIHPIATIVPPLKWPEFRALVDDMYRFGQVEPIWMYQNRVLDGRDRLKACELLGIEPITQEYEGIDPVGFLMSRNARASANQ